MIRSRRWALAIVVGVAGVLALSLLIYLKPVDYEQCMLDTMRGQSPWMKETADHLCVRKARREVAIPVGSTERHFAVDGNVRTMVVASDHYEVTHGTFRFALKCCNQAQPADFITANLDASQPGHFTLPFDEGALALAMTVGGGCLFTDELRGVWK